MGTRIYVVDGQDGLGKTTQLSLLAESLERRGRTLHKTRLLGGDGTDDFQLLLRKLLLHKKFPKDSVELEEQLFAMTDLEGILAAGRFLASNPEGVVLKDRGLASHIAYALAKGMTYGGVCGIHRKVIEAERAMSGLYGVLNLVLVADRSEWLIDRILNRSRQDGTEIVERLENLETQRRVAAALRDLPGRHALDGITFKIIEIEEKDSVDAVRAKIENAILQHNS